jgi:hypothetical protein
MPGAAIALAEAKAAVATAQAVSISSGFLNIEVFLLLVNGCEICALFIAFSYWAGLRDSALTVIEPIQ